MQQKVIAFFTKYPTLNAQALVDFCEINGITIQEFSAYTYDILGSFLGRGLSRKYKVDYDAKQLKLGTIVEMEHTTNPVIAEKIAKDHLTEIHDYYTRLYKMEKEAKEGK